MVKTLRNVTVTQRHCNGPAPRASEQGHGAGRVAGGKGAVLPVSNRGFFRKVIRATTVVAVVAAVDAGALAGIAARAAYAGSMNGASCTFNGSAPPNEGPGSALAITTGSSIAISCTGLPASTFIVFAESSPLAALVPSSDGQDETDTSAVVFGESSSSGDLSGTYSVPSSFSASDSNAQCPPTQAQVNAGLLYCTLAVASTGGTAYAVQTLEYSGQATPAPPSLVLSPTSAAPGATVTVSDASSPSSYWWGGGLTAESSTASPATMSVSVGGTSATASVKVTPPTYDYSTATLTPPVLSGSFTVPSGASAGSATVTVDEANVTADSGNGASDTFGSPYGTDVAASSPLTVTASTSAPSVTGISPTSGAAAGGTSVTITGTGFSTTSGATTVDFGTNPATGVSCSSTTSCTATSPAGSGTVDVTVTTSAGTSATSSSDKFTYNASAGGVSCTFNGSSPSTTGPGSSLAVTPGESVSVSCTGLSPSTGYAIAEASPLGEVITPTSDNADEADMSTLQMPTSTSSGTISATFTIASTFKASDPNAQCPPTQAQVDAGLTNCILSVANVSTQKSADTVALDYSGQPTPAAPTLVLSPTSAAQGATVTVSDASSPSGYWWGLGATTATSSGASPTLAVDIGSSAVISSSVTVSPASYAYNSSTPTSSVLTPPSLSGSFTVPSTAAVGSATVTIDEENPTAEPGNASSSSPFGSAYSTDVQATASLNIVKAVGVPTVTAISPTSGPEPGGTSVTITGTGFSTTSGATTVDFGTNAATGVSCSSTTSCTATSPAGSGTVDVTVTTSAGTSATSSSDKFTYNAPPPGVSCSFDGVSPPANGPGSTIAVAPGQTIVVTCTGLPASTNFALVEASPLGGVVSPFSDAANEADTSGLVAATSDSSGGLSTAFGVPSTFKASDPNAQCPPTQAQVNAGLLDCTLAIASFTGVAYDVQTLQYSGQPTPAAPTLALAPGSGVSGSTVTVSDASSASGFWWGDASSVESSSAVPPTITMTVGSTSVTSSAVQVSLPVYDYSTGKLTPPALTGSFTLPAGLSTGSTTVTLDEANATAVKGNGPANTFGSHYNTDLTASSPFTIATDAYHPLTPARICDTRNGNPSNLSGGAAQCNGHGLGTGSTVAVQVTGLGGVPTGATAVVANVTVTGTSSGGYLTVYPAGESTPSTSNLNWSGPGQTIANLVTVGLSPAGQIEMYNFVGDANVIVDVEGYYGPSSTMGAGLYNPLAQPARICDTRAGNPSNLSGEALTQCESKAPMAGKSLVVSVEGLGGVPSADVAAVVLNVTAVDPSGPGFLTVYPTGSSAPPMTSNVNFTAGSVTPNTVIATLGTGGEVSIYSSNGAPNIVVDVSGWYTGSSSASATGYSFVPESTPARICDTRPQGYPGVVSNPCSGSTLSTGKTLEVQVTGEGGVPAGAKAVVVNVTVTGVDANGYLTLYPSGASSVPVVSDLNWESTSKTVTDMAVVAIGNIGSLGEISAYDSNGTANVIIDVTGWFS